MARLIDDIRSHSDWLVKAFAADGLKLDYTIDSLIEVDWFFVRNLENGQPKKGGRIPEEGFGSILFSIGSYVGETIIRNVNGAEWMADDDDPDGEVNLSLKLPGGEQIWPVQKVMKRFQKGGEDAIYPYVHAITRESTKLAFNEKF